MKQDSRNSRNDTTPEGTDADVESADEVDLEVALVAALAARDVGGGPDAATETVDLGKLTPNEKQALLQLLRERLHLPPAPPAQEGGGA